MTWLAIIGAGFLGWVVLNAVLGVARGLYLAARDARDDRGDAR